ncbi:replicative DNA helicase [Pseudoduganella violaceinigra]|uniref:replicative DNA helicase n=1 Tax=Pseudoduganella violaceinigra TaxID=246602 RepID=UPI0003FB42CC|nr:replicative DNA helicase [Pseudoduganella violaceinigra]
MLDPLPLFAEEAEQSVIGALLRHNGAIDDLGDLAPDHFYRADHRMVYVEVLRQIKAKQRADVVTVGLALPDLPDGMAYLNSIAQSVPSAANVRYYASIVRDRAVRRTALAMLNEYAQILRRPGPRPVLEELDALQSKLGTLSQGVVIKEPVRLAEAMVPYLERFEGRTDGVVRGTPTGFEDLDALLTGGPRDGALVIVAGRPSMGKTALAMNIATNVAGAGYPTCVLSQEMMNDDLLDREFAQVGSIDLKNIIRASMSSLEWDRFGQANITMADMPLWLDDSEGLTLLQVCRKARQHKRKHGLKLLVIDYLQLMSGDGDPRKNRNTQIEEITRGLKSLAKELGIVILLLSQLNRNGANKSRPQLADLRDSGAIEQDADIVIFVHREEVDNPQTHLKGFADVFVAKNRQGKVDDVLLEYQGPYTRFITARRPRPSDPHVNSQRRGLARDL